MSLVVAIKRFLKLVKGISQHTYLTETRLQMRRPETIPSMVEEAYDPCQ